MFSPTIQKLIDTSGREAAIKRAAALMSYTYNVNPNQLPQNENVQSFASLLQPEENLFGEQKNSDKSKKTPFGTNVINLDSISNPQSLGKLDSSNLKSNKIANNFDMSVSSLINTGKSEIKRLISNIAKKHSVDEKLINAVVNQESGYQPDAVSSAGAQGLMQLMPNTAKDLGVTDPFDPYQNLDAGTRYLKSLLNKYNGNIILALAAYNAGSGNVDKYHGVPPFKETQNYVNNILANYL